MGRATLARLSGSHTLRLLVRDRRHVAGRSDIEMVEGDIRNARVLERAVAGCEAVVHLAAVTDAADPRVDAINVEGTRALVEAAPRVGIKRFVFWSGEKVLQQPWDRYAWSKAEGERVVRTSDQYTILRPTMVHGPGDSKVLGKLFSWMVRYPAVPVSCGVGSRLQPVFVDDVVSCIVGAIEGRGVGGTFVVAGPDRLLPEEIVATIVRHLGARRAIVKVPWCCFSAAVRVQAMARARHV